MDDESQRIYDRMTLHRLSEAHPKWGSTQLAVEVGRSDCWLQNLLIATSCQYEYFHQQR